MKKLISTTEQIYWADKVYESIEDSEKEEDQKLKEFLKPYLCETLGDEEIKFKFLRVYDDFLQKGWEENNREIFETYLKRLREVRRERSLKNKTQKSLDKSQIRERQDLIEAEVEVKYNEDLGLMISAMEWDIGNEDGDFDFFLKLSESQKYEITRMSAKKSTIGISKYIQNYEIESEDKRYEIAKISAKNEGKLTSEYIANYKIKNKKYLYEILAISLNQDMEGTLQFINNYGKIDLNLLNQSLKKVTGNKNLNLYEFMGRRNAGLYLLDFFEKDENKNNSEINTHDAIGNILGLENKGEKIKKPNKTKRDKKNAPSSFAYGNFYEQVILLNELLWNSEKINLESFFEINKNIFDKRSLNDFTKFLGNIYALISIFPEKKSEALNYLKQNIAEILSQKNETEKLKDQTKQNISEVIFYPDLEKNNSENELDDNQPKSEKNKNNSELNAGNIKIINTLLEKTFNEWFAKFMGLEDENAQNNLLRLKEEWGDLEVFQILFMRYYAKEEWAECIPVMRNITKHSLNGNFGKYKYEGFHDLNEEYEGFWDAEDEKDTTLRQLDFLTEEEKNIWKEDPSRLDFFDGKNEDKSEEEKSKEQEEESLEKLKILKKSINQVGQNIKNALNQDLGIKNKNLEEILKITEIKDFELSFEKKNIKKYKNNLREVLNKDLKGILGEDFMKKLGEKGLSNLVNLILLKEYYEAIAQEKDTEKQKKLFSELRNISQDVFENFPQIRKDMGVVAINFKNLNKKKNLKIKEGCFIFNTVTDHPNTLMRIGNLVQGTGSCQDFRTGEYIQTLTGYVADANVKALLRFIIKESDFKNSGLAEKDFEWLRENQENNTLKNPIFDGGKMTVTFENNSGKKIKIILPDPKNRNMLKMGDIDEGNKKIGGRGGIFTEISYTQSDGKEVFAEEKSKKLLDDWCERGSFSQNKKIKVMKSRNPEGHYSDEATGIMTNDYYLGS